MKKLDWAFLAACCLFTFCLGFRAHAAYPYDAVGHVSTGGSGTMIYVQGEKGLVATSAHVVPTVSKVTVTWDKQERECETVFVDYRYDIALLVCPDPPVRAVPHRNPVGNFVVSTGYPFYDRGNLHWQISIGLRSVDEMLWVTHKPVAGMSGGGAFDHGGYFIGIVKCHSSTDGGLVSNNILMNTLDKFKDSKTWVPNADHVVILQDYNYSSTKVKVRSIKYDELTAPELPDITRQEYQLQ